MAVQNVLAKSGLTLKYKEGVDEKGTDIVKTKKYSNVKVSAVDQNIYDVAAALTPLMRYRSLEMVRTNDSILSNA